MNKKIDFIYFSMSGTGYVGYTGLQRRWIIIHCLSKPNKYQAKSNDNTRRLVYSFFFF